MEGCSLDTFSMCTSSLELGVSPSGGCGDSSEAGRTLSGLIELESGCFLPLVRLVDGEDTSDDLRDNFGIFGVGLGLEAEEKQDWSSAYNTEESPAGLSLVRNDDDDTLSAILVLGLAAASTSVVGDLVGGQKQ